MSNYSNLTLLIYKSNEQNATHSIRGRIVVREGEKKTKCTLFILEINLF